MRFTAWLWNQVDDLGDQEAFAKICWDDVNNGCANARFSAKDWVKHFDDKHRDSRDDLVFQLITAFQQYKKFIDEM